MSKQSKSCKLRSFLRRHSTHTSSGRNAVRGLCVAALAGFMIAQATVSMGRSGNILNTIEAPGVGGPTVEKRDIGAGDMSYASKTGAFQYSYGFTVPPGRNGMQPGLALSYSSQGSIRGSTIGANWSMGIPMIERDTSEGTLGLAPGMTDHNDLPFVSSMAGGHRLVAVTEPVETGWSSYRAEYDDSYTRYERNDYGGQWRARTLDGKTWYFGIGHAGEEDSVDYPPDLIVDSKKNPFNTNLDHQPLTRVVDKYGNTIRYQWIAISNTVGNVEEFRLDEIRYTENYSAGLGAHARVEFDYIAGPRCDATAKPTVLQAGASVSYRGGEAFYKGRSQLERVVTHVRDEPDSPERVVRQIELDIYTVCPDAGSSSRQLVGIRTVDPAAPGASLLRSITFGYGPVERSFDGPAKSITLPPYTESSRPFSFANPLSWGYVRGYGAAQNPTSGASGAESTLEQTLLDFNRDGLLDVVRSGAAGTCEFQVWLASEIDGDVTFAGPPLTFDFPDEGLAWANGDDTNIGTAGPGEGCSLSARRTLWMSGTPPSTAEPLGNYLSYRFIDMNRDGYPDLVTSVRMDGCINAALPHPDPSMPPGTNIDIPGVSWLLGTHSNPLEDVGYDTAALPTTEQCLELSNADLVAARSPSCPGGDCERCTAVDMDALQTPIAEATNGNCGNHNVFTPADDVFGGYAGSHCGHTLDLRRNGHYPWKVYYNEGPGSWIDVSSSSFDYFWSPVPLSPSNGEGSLGTGNGIGFSSSKHAVMDMTGDGIIDVVARGNVATAFPVWYVFPGELDDVDGTFAGFAEQPQWWAVPGNAAFGSSKGYTDPSSPTGGTFITQMASESQLVDLNGDGLPDLLARHGTDLRVAMNMGSGFCSRDGNLTASDVSLDESALSRTGYTNVLRQPLTPQPDPTAIDIAGDGESLTRLIDVDGDGLPEYVDAWDSSVNFAALRASADVRGNGGNGGFENGNSADADMDTHLPRAVEVTNQNDWFVLSESMDLNGDGYLDVVDESSSSEYFIKSEDVAAGEPLRLLNKIDNGQGLTTEVEYRPYSNSVAQAGVGQTRMKLTVFVTTKVTTSSSQINSSFTAAPDSEVNINYGNVMYNEDHRGRWSFRGFESIGTSAPHAVGAATGFSVTAQNYDYDLDWSGRLSETMVYTDGFAKQKVASITTISLQENSLFDGATSGFTKVQTTVWNCGLSDGEITTESVCRASEPLKVVLHSTKALRAHPDTTGVILAYTENQQNTAKGWNNPLTSVGVLMDRIYPRLYSNSNTYWTHTYQDVHWIREASGWAQIRNTFRELDATNTVIERESKFTGLGGVWNHSGFTYELATGLLTATQSPKHLDSAFKAMYGYDPAGFKITADSITNELHQTSTTVTDLGTGLPLETRGPTPLACDPAQNAGSRTEYDKLGRPVDVFEIGCFAGVAGEEPVAHFRYVNFRPTSGTPAFVQSTFFQEGSSGAGVVAGLYVDGAGRTLLSVAGVGANETQSEFVYNARGNVVESLTPNPATSGPTAPVSTRYAYDSLGRVIEVEEDVNLLTAAILTRSLEMAYGFDGANTLRTVREETIDGGPEGETVTYTDLFGRLVQVDELGGGSTYYEYDGNDNVIRITDADNSVTEMEHDWLSRRTKVIRGERIWTYAYDRNGNMIAETSPNNIGEEASPSPGPLYTTKTVYDALDRPDSRILATRGHSAATLAVYDAITIDFTYDNCDNGLGRLCSVDVGNNLHTEYTYDHAGRVTQETKGFSLPESVVDFLDGDTDPDFVDTRTSNYEYNLAGALTNVLLADSTNQADATHLSYNYNSRGEPTDLTWHRPSGDVVTSVSRNAARRITQQHTGCLTRNWEYDHLGQVTRTEVIGGPGAGSAPGAVDCITANGPLLSEAMTYFHSSEVATHVVHRTGLMKETFTYQYDSQHQLIRAATGGATPVYDVDFAFTAAGRIAEVGSISSIGRPNLDYAPTMGGYGDGTLTGGDEHAPVSLVGPDMHLQYDYDYAGNVTQRQEVPSVGATEAWSFAYDGTDQQREVLTPGGGRELYYYDHGGARYMTVTFDDLNDTEPSRIRVWMGGAEIWYEPGAGQMDVAMEFGHLSLGALNIGRVKKETTGTTTVTTTEGSFHNGLSHLMGAVDWDSGVITAAYVYGPFGEVVASVGAEEDEHLRRFNGKEADAASGLNYYEYRYYDSASLSWTQADPLYLMAPDVAADEPRRMSLYAFSLNNPVRYLDPDGRDPTFVVATGDNIVANKRQYYAIDSFAKRVAWAKATIDVFKINAAPLGLTSITVDQENKSRAAINYNGQLTLNATSDGYLSDTASIFHEIAHLEINRMLFGTGVWTMGDWRNLLSERYARAAMRRMMVNLYDSGLIGGLLSLQLGRTEMNETELSGYSEEDRTIVDAILANGSSIEAIVDTLAELTAEEQFYVDSRKFESNATGNSMFDFIWENQRVFTAE